MTEPEIEKLLRDNYQLHYADIYTVCGPFVPPLKNDSTTPQFSVCWDEGDSRFKHANLPKISYVWTLFGDAPFFRLCLRYGRYRLTTPFIVDGIL
jgi:hypothetical protein